MKKEQIKKIIQEMKNQKHFIPTIIDFIISGNYRSEDYFTIYEKLDISNSFLTIII